MSRWEADAAGRFRAAALELFVEVGYEQTTVAAISARAGLTPRTFFRHFADKREVLFDGAERFQRTIVESVSRASLESGLLDAVVDAMKQAGDLFNDERRSFARLRRDVIHAHAHLHERESTKLASLSSALASTLCLRGAREPDASLAAGTGIAIFRIAYAQWVAESESRDFGTIVGHVHARLKQLVSDPVGERPDSESRSSTAVTTRRPARRKT